MLPSAAIQCRTIKMPAKKLEGKVAVITGASRGLGRAMAISLAAEGARIALVARNKEKLADVAAELIGSGGEAKVFPADVSNEAAALGLAREVQDIMGPAAILINNAGMNIRKKLIDFSLQEWNSVMETNVTSVFLMCRAFVPQMLGAGYGRILNLCSIMS